MKHKQTQIQTQKHPVKTVMSFKRLIYQIKFTYNSVEA